MNVFFSVSRYFVPAIACLACLLIFSNNQVLAQSKVGTKALTFLEIGVGARGVGMGEAHVSSTRDVASLYWNPAGITNIFRNEATFQHTTWIADSQLNYAAAAFGAGRNAHVGLQFYVFDSGNMDVTTVDFPDGTGEQFNVQDLKIGLTYARKLTNRFAIGGSVKYISSRIWRMSTSAVALDLGMQYHTPIDNLRLGFAISNFGEDITLTGDNTSVRVDLDRNSTGTNDALLGDLRLGAWDLPLMFRIGSHYKFNLGELQSVILSADAIYPNNDDPFVNAGMEYGFRDMVFLRGGYSRLFLPDAEGHFRLGFGVAISNTIRADYAYSDRGRLGGSNLLGATIMF